MKVLGLDIGGANLKAAHTLGRTRTISFPLWRRHRELEGVLAAMIAAMPPAEIVGLTMSGELCDCFADQGEGVLFLLDAAVRVVGGTRLRVWSRGGFLSPEEAAQAPEQVAAANWSAQAAWVARRCGAGSALLVDMGSTTTDIVPLAGGKAISQAYRDPDRLDAGELVYTGAGRTPVAAVLGGGEPAVAAEFFATMRDVYLVLGRVEEDAEDLETADGRPATRVHACGRLARMRCADPATYPFEEIENLAKQAAGAQGRMVLRGIAKVLQRMPEVPATVLLSGSGEAILDGILEGVPYPRERLSGWLGAGGSEAACAYAVAHLAAEAPADG